MLHSEQKKEALEIYDKAVQKYNATYNEMTKNCGILYEKRQSSVSIIEAVNILINSIANSPKEFESKLTRIEQEKEEFRKTEEYATEAYDAAIKSGAGVAAGVAGGAAIASLAPSVAMWVATTFGTTSTGVAISTLYGAAATNAALAWLGGGALAAGGAGMAGGHAFLALAGPIGWGIAGASATASIASLSIKNKKLAAEAIAQAKEITMAGAQLHESDARILNLISETDSLFQNVGESLGQLKSLATSDYAALPEEAQLGLGALVNNTLSLAELLNKTVD